MMSVCKLGRVEWPVPARELRGLQKRMGNQMCEGKGRRREGSRCGEQSRQTGEEGRRVSERGDEKKGKVGRGGEEGTR